MVPPGYDRLRMYQPVFQSLDQKMNGQLMSMLRLLRRLRKGHARPQLEYLNKDDPTMDRLLNIANKMESPKLEPSQKKCLTELIKFGYGDEEIGC